MKFLYLLENIRFPLLDEFMLLVTQLGEETAFLAAALIVFWCIDKNRGYYIMTVGFIGTIFNQFLKLLCRVPRPWVLDPDFQPVEGAVEAATGYSFPSGHSQSSVGTFGALAVTTQQKVLRCIFAAICVLVPLSRMYLGVHTPADVLVGAGTAVVMVFAFQFVSRGKHIKSFLLMMAGVSVLFLAFVQFILNPDQLDAHNYASGIKNAYTLMGSIFGVLVVYFVDEKWVHFDVKAIWWAQLMKIAGGIGLVLLVKSGLKNPLNALLGEYPGRAARYFLIVVVAGILWPMTFQWFSHLGKKD